jgi:hypothetical protein
LAGNQALAVPYEVLKASWVDRDQAISIMLDASVVLRSWGGQVSVGDLILRSL